jgi:hypothetical protein
MVKNSDMKGSCPECGADSNVQALHQNITANVAAQDKRDRTNAELSLAFSIAARVIGGCIMVAAGIFIAVLFAFSGSIFMEFGMVLLLVFGLSLALSPLFPRKPGSRRTMFHRTDV